MRRLEVLAIVALLLLLLPTAPVRRAAGQPTGWRLAAIHPRAASQPTASGKTLRFLLPWRGRIYIGYGDYGANTGPIAVAAYDPATAAIDEIHVSDTEAIENYRPIGDRLFAPAIDRRASADFAAGEPWRDIRTINTTHAYDMASQGGQDLWLVGSQGTSAAAWRSLDGGETWRRELAIGPVSGLADDFARFYFADVLGGRLYLQADDYYGRPHPGSRVFDGRAWTPGPDLLGAGSGWRPVEFLEHLVYRGDEYGGALMSFDGARVRELIRARCYAVEIAGGQLYALLGLVGEVDCPPGGCEAVVRTADLSTWEILAQTPPAGVRSLAAEDGALYAGGSEAQLFILDAEPVWEAWPARWNARPTLEIVEPADGATFATGEPFRLVADARDPDGAGGLAARVQFWQGSTRLAELSAPPHAVTATLATTGTHRLDARAIDADGAFVERRVRVNVVEASVPPTSGPLPTSSAPPSRPTPSPAATATTRWPVYLPMTQRQGGTVARGRRPSQPR